MGNLLKMCSCPQYPSTPPWLPHDLVTKTTTHEIKWRATMDYTFLVHPCRVGKREDRIQVWWVGKGMDCFALCLSILWYSFSGWIGKRNQTMRFSSTNPCHLGWSEENGLNCSLDGGGWVSRKWGERQTPHRSYGCYGSLERSLDMEEGLFSIPIPSLTCDVSVCKLLNLFF